jgi:hypothetical protein
LVPENRTVSATDKQALTAAFVAFTHLPAQDIAGTEPGSVYDAYLPSTGTYWALARFSPTPTASQQTLVSLQDGGNMGIFSRRASDMTWTMLTAGGVPFCPTKTPIPPTVRSLWGLSDPLGCSAS